MGPPAAFDLRVMRSEVCRRNAVVVCRRHGRACGPPLGVVWLLAQQAPDDPYVSTSQSRLSSGVAACPYPTCCTAQGGTRKPVEALHCSSEWHSGRPCVVLVFVTAISAKGLCAPKLGWPREFLRASFAAGT
jgi:hypothetical protein